jgi:signal transduction histidine kinase
MRLLAVISIVVAVSTTTTTAVALTVGPPMIRRLMDQAIVPGRDGNHPYEAAFRHATSLSVGIALAASALAALTVSWYLSRRVHRSATALSRAATAIARGHYDIRVPPPGLGKEFDAVAVAFNTMAQQLGMVDDTRRQMLADLAHEIRTPVAVLDAYMEALEDGVRRLDEDAFRTLRDQTQRLARFSLDVSALTVAERRPTSIDESWVSPKGLADKAVAAFMPRFATKGVTLTTHVPEGLPAVRADPERLGQVIGNLLDNALRHTDAGGRVDVRSTTDDDVLAISVRDDGDGLDAEHLTRVFDRFYRADDARDRRYGGAGIGLSIAKALVEAHGGHIEVRSDGRGNGCTFTIVLPYRNERSAETLANHL